MLPALSQNATDKKYISYIHSNTNYIIMKTKLQYRKEALARVYKLNLKQQPKKSKLKYFSKVSNGGYLVRMITQERI
jgi:hypothetical protein